MKKILVVSGSPRKKGNTMKIVSLIEEISHEMDENIKFEYIYLIEKKLEYCRGCCICLKKGGNNCPLKDDKDEILSQMHNADALIFASPGYSHMVSGLYKNFMDRFMYLDHLPELINKPALIISTTGGDGAASAPSYMNKKSILWWGCNIVDTIGIAHAFYVLNEKYQKKINKKLYNAANKLINEISNVKMKSPTFEQYICFKANQAELLISPTVAPQRTQFWLDRNWLEQEYYYPVKVNLIYRFAGATLLFVMKIAFRIMIGENMDEKMKKYLEDN